MIDGHVHIHNNPLNKETILKYVNEAKNKGITTLQILDHTHKFKEFKEMYDPMLFIKEQYDWLSNDFKYSINDFINLKNEMQKEDLPIKVLFGLEVCYQKADEDLIRKLLSPYKLDFLVGSVHSIYHIAYDSKWSVKELWEKYPTDQIYRDYYNEVFSLVKSGLFSQLGHPDTIKMFNYYPTYDLTGTYDQLAKLLNEHHMKVENNVGCYYRYHHKDMGLSNELLNVFKQNGCELITASDAHNANDIGTNIKDVQDITFNKF